MIEKEFWEDVRNAWILKAPPQIRDTKTSSEGEIDPDLLQDPWDMDGIPFDMLDFDQAVEAGLTGKKFEVKNEYRNMMRSTSVEIKVPEKRSRPKLETTEFEEFMGRQTIRDYIEACKLLLKCELPEKMEKVEKKLMERMAALQDCITKFGSIYQTDLSQFQEYYIPEALQLTASYLEYIDEEIDENTIKETEMEVLDAVEQLLAGVNDKIEEIRKFAAIELQAKAKALESMLSQDGYIDPEFKIK